MSAPTVAELVRRYDPSLPLEDASTPPAAWYTDPRIAALERRTVFARTWQFAARLDQLRGPGDYVTCEIAGEPILVVRGDDGVLRGFFNVCRHHAAAVNLWRIRSRDLAGHQLAGGDGLARAVGGAK